MVKITKKERQLLEVLYAARGLRILTPADILSSHPVTFEGRSPQGIHATAASLARKGLVYTDQDDNGHVAYHIRQAGADVLREDTR
jgi:Fe2+ or Zn2+ uptake regulation protein